MVQGCVTARGRAVDCRSGGPAGEGREGARAGEGGERGTGGGIEGSNPENTLLGNFDE